MRPKLLRISTVPQTLFRIFKSQLDYIKDEFDIVTVSGPFDQKSSDVYGTWMYKHYEVQLSRTISPAQDFKAIQQLVRIIRKERVDIVHSHTPKAGLVGMIAARIAGVPIRMHTVAGMPLEAASGVKKQILLAAERLTYSFATHVSANAYGMRDLILKHRLIAPGKLKVIGYGASTGVDVSYFNKTEVVLAHAQQIRSDQGFQDTDIICCFIGRLTRQKGVEELIDVFQELMDDDPRIRLIMLGRYEQHLDPVDEHYVQIIEQHPRIHHYGYVSDVRPYLAMSELFVFPSYREGMPNVVLQACCFNLPCVVTDISGSNEVIQNGVNGIVVPVRDRRRLKAACYELIHDSELRQRMGSCSRMRIQERYDQQMVLENLKQEYKHLLHEKGI